MIKSFDQYLNEALSLKRSDRGAHFLERAEQRLNGLKVVGVIRDKEKSVTKLDTRISKDIEYFFKKTLAALADPTESLLFRETDIAPAKIGLVLMARPYVILPDGTGATPVFSVYERTDNDRAVNREGSYFWIVTIGSDAQTILLHQHDGRRESQRESLIDRSIKHITQSREAELARLSRISGIDFNLKSEVKAAHEVITRTIGGGRLELDLTRPESIEQLTNDSVSNLKVNREDPLIRDMADRGDFEFRLESSSKQMTVSPRTWFMERNEKFGVWGAMPILSSKLIKGVTGNEIWLEVGDKWVYWLGNEGVFNAPRPSSQRIITKGDKVSLAKEVGGGSFLINTGIVSEISLDSRSSEYPYFKTEDWISNEVITTQDAQKIFKRKGAVVENRALTFNQYLDLQENIQRIKQMNGLLTEVTNPYKVEWIEPSQEYFKQELSELLGNEMRFSKGEFFHPNNYDQMYSLFPHTFKMIAEHSKGEEVESDEEIKEILLDKEVYELMDDWGDFRHVLMKDDESQKEGFNFFNKGEMKLWKGTNSETGEYIDNTDKTFYMGKLGKFMEWEPDYKDTTTGGFTKQYKDSEYKDQLGGYVRNIEQQRDYARKGETRELPAPFVIKLSENDREGNEYVLIGGHKRSTMALQMGVEPIKVWFIDLTK